MQHFLDKKGLSMTQAQTVSNLCNQAANEMLMELDMINNSTKTLEFNGKTITKQEGHLIPTAIEDNLAIIGDYRACQAFLMEQIKAKDQLLTAAKNAQFATTELPPEMPEMRRTPLIEPVRDQWGWDQLTKAELAEYWQTEAKAAVIGQFIHKGGKLDQLRKELPKIEPLEWFVAPGHEGKAHPVRVEVHHEQMDLWNLHQDLSNIHRELEQRVNYFKAKVKNLVTLRNAEIANENAQKLADDNAHNSVLREEYQKEYKKWVDNQQMLQKKFEAERLETLREISALRIQVDSRFQSIVDELLGKDNKEEDQ